MRTVEIPDSRLRGFRNDLREALWERRKILRIQAHVVVAVLCGSYAAELAVLSKTYPVTQILAVERTRAGDVMSDRQVANGDRIIAPMIALAGCATRHRIVVAGSKSMELMLELHRRGYLRAAATGNCGRPAGQYDVALVDWRRRTLHALEPTLDWLMDFLGADSVLVVWVDAQKPAATQSLRAALETRGFVIEQSTVHDCGCALSARRRQAHPLQKAA